MLEPVQMLISVSGVALVLLLVWLATRRESPVVLGGEAGARALIERELLGFEVAHLAVDVGGRRALALSRDGKEVALAYVMGSRPTCWRLPAAGLEPLGTRPAGEGIVAVDVPTGDFTRRTFSLELQADDARSLLGLGRWAAA